MGSELVALTLLSANGAPTSPSTVSGDSAFHSRQAALQPCRPPFSGEVRRLLRPQLRLPSNRVPFANCHHFLPIALQALLLAFSSEKLLSLCEVTSFRGYSLTLGILLCNYNCQVPQAGKTFELLKVLGDGRKKYLIFLPFPV